MERGGRREWSASKAFKQKSFVATSFQLSFMFEKIFLRCNICPKGQASNSCTQNEDGQTEGREKRKSSDVEDGRKRQKIKENDEVITKEEEKNAKTEKKEKEREAISSRRRRAKRGSEDPPETVPKADPTQSEASVSSLNHSGRFDVSAQASTSPETSHSPCDRRPCFLESIFPFYLFRRQR